MKWNSEREREKERAFFYTQKMFLAFILPAAEYWESGIEGLFFKNKY